MSKSLSPKALWNSGRPVFKDELSGDFTVKILSGPCIPLRWVYKEWEKSITLNSGYNILNGRRCGYFNICHLPHTAYLKYNTPQNVHTYWYKLCDHIRRLPQKEPQYIGQIYYKFLNKPHFLNRPYFLGYFTLTQKETPIESIF